MSAPVAVEDLIRRAFVNLHAVRKNLPKGFVHEEALYRMFATALDELHSAGFNVAEWRMPADAVGNTHSNEFAARIDALLLYFTTQQEQKTIGFRAPRR